MLLVDVMLVRLLLLGFRMRLKPNLVQVMSTLLAPLIAVFVFDERCFRFYILFTQDLREIFDSWDLGMTGLAAYRCTVWWLRVHSVVAACVVSICL